MAAEMFRDVVRPSVTVGNTQRYTVPCSIAVHVVAVCALVIVPLLATDTLPSPASTVAAFLMPVAPPPPPPSAPVRTTPPKTADAMASPLEAPPSLSPESFDASIGDTADLGGDLPSLVVGEPIAAVPPPPPPVAAPPPAEPIRVGGNITAPAKTKDVRPVYPPVAMEARIQGLVIIEATIGPTGHVVAARVLRSVPLLDQAAVDAVNRWEFTPTLLNGTPVPVIMTVTVQFTLR